MIDAPVLYRPALLGWSERPPRALVRFGSLAVGVAMLVVSIVQSESDGGPAWTAAVSTSPGYLLSSLLQGAFIGSLVVLLLAPRLGTPLTAVAGTLAALDPWGAYWGAGGPLWWGGVGVLTVVAVVDGLGLARQVAAARTWAAGPVVVPEAPDEVVRQLTGWRRVYLAVATLAVVGAAVAVVWTWHDLRAVEEFRATATTVPGVVVSVADDDLSARVDLGGGNEVEVPLPTEYVAVDDEVQVTVGDGRAELVIDPFDPFGGLIPAATGLLVAAAMVLVETHRRRTLRGLLRHGAPAVQVNVTWSEEHGGLLLHCRDDALRPVALLPAPYPLAAWLTGDEDEDDAPRQVADLDDAELLAHADEVLREDDEDPDENPHRDVLVTWSHAPALVVGLRRDGEPVALHGPDGVWLLSEPIRRPARRIRALRAAGRGIWWTFGDAAPPAERSSAPAGPGSPLSIGAAWIGRGPRSTEDAGGVDGTTARPSVPPARPSRGRAGLRQVGRRTGGWGPWLVLPAVAWFASWVAPETDWWRGLMLVAAAASVGPQWATAARTRLRLAPSGLVVAGSVRDELVPWTDVLGAAANDTSLVIRVRDTEDGGSEQDAILLAWAPELAPLLAGDPTPQAAAATLERARLAPPVAGRGVAPLATPTVVGVVWVAVTAAAFFSSR